jgi:hypothetical protein
VLRLLLLLLPLLLASWLLLLLLLPLLPHLLAFAGVLPLNGLDAARAAYVEHLERYGVQRTPHCRVCDELDGQLGAHPGGHGLDTAEES